MTGLAIPDPRNETVPRGWWEDFAKPVIMAAESWVALDEIEARLKAFMAYIGALSGDAVEFTKALRLVEIRRGELLDPRRPIGRPLKNSPRVESFESDASGPTQDRWRRLAEHRDVIEPVLAEATDVRQVTQTRLLAVVREHTPARPDADLPDVDDERLALVHGDFRDRLESMEDGSVDLIVTDPPYPKEDLPLYSDLAKVAARLLGPRGIAFVWTGQIYLPEVIDRLSEHLRYGWTFALLLPGSGARIMGRHIVQGWKPVLAFTVGTWPSGEWGDDVLVSPAVDKTDYEWQQNAAPARRLIERYSPPDGLVVDPFLGVGSFGAAAVEAGRRFVGVELDAERFAVARDRCVG